MNRFHQCAAPYHATRETHSLRISHLSQRCMEKFFLLFYIVVLCAVSIDCSPLHSRLYKQEAGTYHEKQLHRLLSLLEQTLVLLTTSVPHTSAYAHTQIKAQHLIKTLKQDVALYHLKSVRQRIQHINALSSHYLGHQWTL